MAMAHEGLGFCHFDFKFSVGISCVSGFDLSAIGCNFDICSLKKITFWFLILVVEFGKDLISISDGVLSCIFFSFTIQSLPSKFPEKKET